MHTVFVMASPRTGLRIFQRYRRRERSYVKKKKRVKKKKKEKKKNEERKSNLRGIVHDADTGVANSWIDKNRNDLFRIICQGSLRSPPKFRRLNEPLNHSDTIYYRYYASSRSGRLPEAEKRTKIEKQTNTGKSGGREGWR